MATTKKPAAKKTAKATTASKNTSVKKTAEPKKETAPKKVSAEKVIKKATTKPAAAKPAAAKPAMETPAPAMEAPAMEAPAMEAPAMEAPAMEETIPAVVQSKNEISKGIIQSTANALENLLERPTVIKHTKKSIATLIELGNYSFPVELKEKDANRVYITLELDGHTARVPKNDKKFIEVV
jgi:hypothetical protein